MLLVGSCESGSIVRAVMDSGLGPLIALGGYEYRFALLGFGLGIQTWDGGIWGLGVFCY